MKLPKIELNQYEYDCLIYSIQHNGKIHSASAVAKKNESSNTARYTKALNSLTNRKAFSINNKTWVLSESIPNAQREILQSSDHVLSQQPKKTRAIVKRALRTKDQERFRTITSTIFFFKINYI